MHKNFVKKKLNMKFCIRRIKHTNLQFYNKKNTKSSSFCAVRKSHFYYFTTLKIKFWHADADIKFGLIDRNKLNKILENTNNVLFFHLFGNLDDERFYQKLKN